jgi:hypothetical protein
MPEEKKSKLRQLIEEVKSLAQDSAAITELKALEQIDNIFALKNSIIYDFRNVESQYIAFYECMNKYVTDKSLEPHDAYCLLKANHSTIEDDESGQTFDEYYFYLENKFRGFPLSQYLDIISKADFVSKLSIWVKYELLHLDMELFQQSKKISFMTSRCADTMYAKSTVQ